MQYFCRYQSTQPVRGMYNFKFCVHVKCSVLTLNRSPLFMNFPQTLLNYHNYHNYHNYNYQCLSVCAWWWGLIKLPFIPSKCHSYHHASTFWIRQNACMFWANQSAGISIISIFIRQIVSIVMLQCTFLPLVLKSLLQYMCAVISMASFTQIDCDTFSQNHLCFR